MPDVLTAPQQRLSALYSALAQVPSGKVVSYGQLAELAGLGRAARFVGRTLANLPAQSTLPWHRVVRADGSLGLTAESTSGVLQRRLLSQEGIELDKDRVNLKQHRWHP